jgi:hypothetical protein
VKDVEQCKKALVQVTGACGCASNCEGLPSLLSFSPGSGGKRVLFVFDRGGITAHQANPQPLSGVLPKGIDESVNGSLVSDLSEGHNHSARNSSKI